METDLDLIGRIYDSAADASCWQNFLDAFVQAHCDPRSDSLLVRLVRR
jgi:hypothetical protein